MNRNPAKIDTRVTLDVFYNYQTNLWTVRKVMSDRAVAKATRGGFGLLHARQSFPNDKGNYRGKRTPRPATPARTPRELFNSLTAHYLTHRQTYRNGPLADPNWQRRYFAENGKTYRAANAA